MTEIKETWFKGTLVHKYEYQNESEYHKVILSNDGLWFNASDFARGPKYWYASPLVDGDMFFPESSFEVITFREEE